MTTRGRAPRLGAGALAEYQARGWHITEHRRPDAGTTPGPCARCQLCHVYGPKGRNLCADCDPGVPS